MLFIALLCYLLLQLLALSAAYRKGIGPTLGVLFPPFEIKEWHESGIVDFVNRGGFGYVAPDRKVFGFQSHAFRKLPELHSPKTGTKWMIQRLDLVSLLKHESPVAYVSKNLPMMEELRDAPTRELDPFEADALSKLRRGEDLVIDQGKID